MDKIKLERTAVAIGMFDGLHKGHTEIIKKLKINNLSSCVFSFDMSEYGLFNKLKIITEKKKRKLLKDLGVDYYINPQFEMVKNFEAQDFVVNFLVGQLDAKVFIAGEDFRFGLERQGDTKLLEKLLESHGRKLMIAKTQNLEKKDNKIFSKTKISSSNIRTSIQNGDVELANQMLGRNFSLDFEVQKLEENFFVQDIARQFVALPDGTYRSLLNIDGKTTKTQTQIFCFRNNKIAKTFFQEKNSEKLVAGEISVEIIKKIK